MVLEARNRVGGRVCKDIIDFKDENIPGFTQCYCDTGILFNHTSLQKKFDKTKSKIKTKTKKGGAYVGPTQNRLLKLAKRFGIKTYCVPIEGQNAWVNQSKIQYYKGTIPNGSVLGLLDLNNILMQWDKMAENHINLKGVFYV